MSEDGMADLLDFVSLNLDLFGSAHRTAAVASVERYLNMKLIFFTGYFKLFNLGFLDVEKL
ncbi:hypothetical protein SG0102_12600 [Intestinibaculum porci]|uniref:Uncharacterized protein n=1 Tax=Intestinibaculum porci TaxID=2487118 RepID=A0A3G9JSH7_9FIRM|nr:hypothetical protein SG0102_07280 [Intestinibaculum porci]BBH26326.1 hypothetical protein SG0102_12600 [Intestinibaculum porci]